MVLGIPSSSKSIFNFCRQCMEFLFFEKIEYVLFFKPSVQKSLLCFYSPPCKQLHKSLLQLVHFFHRCDNFPFAVLLFVIFIIFEYCQNTAGKNNNIFLCITHIQSSHSENDFKLYCCERHGLTRPCVIELK